MFCKSYDEAVDASLFYNSLADEFFGMYFNNVQRCLSIMESQEAIASGQGVFDALYYGNLQTGCLSFFARRANVGETGASQWDDFLSEEGYKFVETSWSTSSFLEVSLFNEQL